MSAVRACHRPPSSSPGHENARPRKGTGACAVSVCRRSGRELPQHIVEDAAVHIIFDLVRRIDAAERVEAERRPVGARDLDRHSSEEHTSELQSIMRISYAVFCLKKTTEYTKTHYEIIR